VKSPGIYITCPQIQPTGPAGFGGTNAAWTRTRVLQVVVIVAESDPESAEEQIHAWVDLILKVLTADLTFGRTTTNAKFQGAQIGGTGPENGPLTPTGLFTFHCDRWAALGAD
jgi:hypothetical protein